MIRVNGGGEDTWKAQSEVLRSEAHEEATRMLQKARVRSGLFDMLTACGITLTWEGARYRICVDGEVIAYERTLVEAQTYALDVAREIMTGLGITSC